MLLDDSDVYKHYYAIFHKYLQFLGNTLLQVLQLSSLLPHAVSFTILYTE